jgi:hypothetical protein
MTEEVLEVVAEVVEPGDSLQVKYTPAVLSDNLEALSSFVDKAIEPYQDWEIDPNDYEQVKVARGCMADLNKLKDSIETERKRMKREYEKPLKEFEARVKPITQKIEAARAQIKKQVDEVDERFKAMRYEMLETEYLGCAGAIADVIPFTAVLDSKWLNRSTNEVKAVNELYDKAEEALTGYKTLQGQQLNHKDEVVKHYAETLDLMGALQLEEQLNEKDRELAEFKARQAELEAGSAKWAAEVIEEADPSATATAVGNVVFVTDKPEPPQESEVLRYSLAMEFTGTREFAQEVATTLKAMGITGATLKCMGVA